MPASFDLRLDEQALRALLTGTNGPVVQDLTRRALRVQNRAKQLCPVDVGRLRSSITHEIRVAGQAVYAIVGTNVEYARYVHDGTGLYGPLHHLIVPKRARFLKFTPKGASKPIFRRFVRGVRPRPFLRDALPAARG